MLKSNLQPVESFSFPAGSNSRVKTMSNLPRSRFVRERDIHIPTGKYSIAAHSLPGYNFSETTDNSGNKVKRLINFQQIVTKGKTLQSSGVPSFTFQRANELSDVKNVDQSLFPVNRMRLLPDDFTGFPRFMFRQFT